MTLAQEISSFRKKEFRGSQSEFASKCGISRFTISKIENGFRPSKDVYLKLSRVTGLPIEALHGLATESKGSWIIEKDIRLSSVTPTNLYAFHDIIFGLGINAFFRIVSQGSKRTLLESNAAIQFRGGLAKVRMSVPKEKLIAPSIVKARIWEVKK